MTIPGMYAHDGYHWSERLRDALPPPPEDGLPTLCQWGQLTTSGPAKEWPQDEYHRSVLQIGLECHRTAGRYAHHACPGQPCATAHDLYLICDHHFMYSCPVWGRNEAGLHGLSGSVLQLATPEWRDWWEDYAARTRRAAGAERDDTHPIMLQPALF